MGYEDEEAVLLEPFTYLTSVPGKGVRGKLMLAFNQWLNVPEDKLVEIGNNLSH